MSRKPQQPGGRGGNQQSPTQSGPQDNKKKRSLLWVSILIPILVALIGAIATLGSAFIGKLTSSTTSHTSTTLTPQEIYNNLANMVPFIDDPLIKQDSQNWSTSERDNGLVSCNFQDGAYHAVARKEYPVALCFDQATNFSDFAFQVQMTIVQGNGTGGGLIFRAKGTSDTSIMYRVRVSNDGSYDYYVQDIDHNHTGNLDLCPDSTNPNSTSPVHNAEKSTSIIETGSQVNILTLIVLRNTMTLFINGQNMGTICDRSSDSGLIGMIASSYKGVAEVSYNNLKVWKLL